MPIQIQCSGCGTAFQASEKFAGKRVKCRNCGAEIQVPDLLEEIEPVLSEQLEPAPALDLLSAPNLVAQPLAPPMNWGAPGGYAAMSGSAPRPSQSVIVLVSLGLVWTGFALCDSVARIRETWPAMRTDVIAVLLPVMMGVLLRVVQMAGLIAIVAALAAIMRRRPWAAPLGLLTSAAITATSFAWVPALDSILGLAYMFQDRTPVASDLLKVILRIGVDIVAFLIVPPLLMAAFHRQIESRSRKSRLPAFKLIVTTATLGWSAFAMVKLFSLLMLYVAAFISVSRYDNSTLVRLASTDSWEYWVTIAGRLICFVAALVMIIAAIGLLLRRERSIHAMLMASGTYAATALIVQIVEATTGRGRSIPLTLIGDSVPHLLAPVAICVWCMLTKDADG